MLNNVKTQKILGFLLGALFTLLLGYTLIHAFGFRIVEGFKIKKVGSLEIVAPLSYTNIFIDESKKISTKKENETVSEKLSPEKHSVIVSRDTYFPWKKDFTIISNQTTKLNPIFISQNPSGNIITSKDPEYYKIKYSIDTNYLPTKTNPVKSPDESILAWVENNEIFAKKGENVFSVAKFDGKISNLEFYKNRNDALVFSSGIGVFVVEIEKEGGQNFMPVYKGQTPTFKGGNQNFIYIYDFGTLMEVVI